MLMTTISASHGATSAEEVMRLLPHIDGFDEAAVHWMLRSVKPAPMEFLLRLCTIYDDKSLYAISNVLMNEYEDSQYKDPASNAELVTFTVVIAPLIASAQVIRAISSNGVSVRKIIPSMLMSRYSDEEFTDWSNASAVHDHIHRVRGAFLNSVIFSPQYDSGADLLWLGKQYRVIVSLLDQLQERQSVDPDLVAILNNHETTSLRDGLL